MTQRVFVRAVTLARIDAEVDEEIDADVGFRVAYSFIAPRVEGFQLQVAAKLTLKTLIQPAIFFPSW